MIKLAFKMSLITVHCNNSYACVYEICNYNMFYSVFTCISEIATPF